MNHLLRGQEGRKEGERKEVIVVANAALHIIINLIYGRRGSSLNTIHILSDLVFNLFHPPPVIICVPFIPTAPRHSCILGQHFWIWRHINTVYNMRLALLPLYRSARISYGENRERMKESADWGD